MLPKILGISDNAQIKKLFDLVSEESIQDPDVCKSALDWALSILPAVEDHALKSIDAEATCKDFSEAMKQMKACGKVHATLP